MRYRDTPTRCYNLNTIRCRDTPAIYDNLNAVSYIYVGTLQQYIYCITIEMPLDIGTLQQYITISMP